MSQLMQIFLTLILLECGYLTYNQPIDEQSNFYPCSFSNNKLLCDINSMTNNIILSFKTPVKVKIETLEIVNLEMEEIPANFISPLSENLLSIKIHSKLPIKLISQAAFSQCSKVKYLELKSQTINADKIIDLNGVFKELYALETLKLINLNIFELKLNQLQKLYVIHVENSNLNMISEDTFTSNRNLSILNIIGLKNSTNLINQFTNWNTNFGVSIINLKLENCFLNYFPKFSENFSKNLTYLSLATNPIEKIDFNDTVNLKELQTLSIAGTSLKINSVQGLIQLKKLKSIDISSIKTISDLPVEIEQLSLLEVIYMDLLELNQISISLPASIMKLSASNLKKSVKISSKFLSKCSKLIYLFLNGLDTSDLKFLVDNVDVFKKTLQSLSCDECVVLKSELWIFIKYLTKLEMLFLNKANIDSIPNDVLNNLSNLKVLSLSGNVLRYDSINTKGFQNISRRLTNLDLSYNQLIHLPPCMFHMFHNLSNINLLETGIDCDCNILWLYKTIRNSTLTFPRLNFTCASGKNTGKTLYELSESDLVKCSSEIDPCLPIDTGYYKIQFNVNCVASNNKFTITNIETFPLKFLFDFMKVQVKQNNKTFHIDVEKIGFNETKITINPEIYLNQFTVCLILIRNIKEYELNYNCLPVKCNGNIIKTANLPMLIGVPIGILLIIVIIVVTVILCRKSKGRRKIPTEEDLSEYSEPNDTYQDPDQYTQIDSNEYSLDRKILDPHIYYTGDNLERIVSKSFNEGLDIRPSSKDLFQKSKIKSSRILKKKLPESISLRNIPLNYDSSLPINFSTRGRASIPNRYSSRNLPNPPEDLLMKDHSLNMPPPKPKFPSMDIQNLLNNADNHLNYFKNYASNTSLCTDESLNQHHSGDSGLGVSKLSSHSQKRFSEDNSVII